MYDAPYYRGSDKLKNRVAIVTGADSGIGRSVCLLFAREGADIAALYLSEQQDAENTQRAIEAEGRQCLLIAGDVRKRAFCRRGSAAHPVWTPLNPSDKVAGKVALFGSDTPMKRPAQPEEIAPAYVFLASGQCSSYITGEVLPIIGGYSGG